MADTSKTEKATPKKRRDERKKGNIFFSNDAVSIVVLLASFFVLKITVPMASAEIYRFLQYCMALSVAGPSDVIIGNFYALFTHFILAFIKSAGPVLATTVVVAVSVTFFQTKMLVSGELVKPKFSRISPLKGIKRLFSLRSIIEALKGLLKISIILYIVYRFLSGIYEVFVKYLHTDLASACAHLFNEFFILVIQISIAYVVLAGADIFYQWWDYERQIKMSKQEVKEEFKQTEGDPQIKSRIKETQRKMAQSRMMQQVPNADVVIRNPTHFAVALRYKPEKDSAPVVLAKGQDELAARIVHTAEEHNIAVIENVPLARALYATTELNREIPSELYNAVAEVLVYLYRIGSGQK